MKNVFLIDEDTFRFAYTGEDESGNSYWPPVQLVANIAANCHKIVLFEELQRKYWQHTDALKQERRISVLNMPSVINVLLRNSDKVVYLTEIFDMDLEGTPEDDRLIVRASIQARAILVTDDGRLLARLHENRTLERYNLRAMPPKDALAFSGQAT